MSFLFVNARVITLAGVTGPRRGAALGDLRVISNGHVRVRDGRIVEVGSGSTSKNPGETVIDAGGDVLLPTWVDCHTHACWAGERFDEFEMALRGASYLEILESGGGIMSTVRAVRAAGEDELVAGLRRRLARCMTLGTGTIEIKSGYGLSLDAELKMLRAIARVRGETTLDVHPTFLGAHAIDRDNPDCVEETIEDVLPAVVREFPGITCDAYCENGAWSCDDTMRLFERARDLGCPLRVHADQFNDLGMIPRAIQLGLRSVDHLEASTDDHLDQLAASELFGVALPASGFHVDDRYAPMRRFIDAGGAAAIASNYNPGSAPTPSIPFTIALACRKLRMTPAEAIAAATWNPACLLGVESEVGSIEAGKRADLQLLDCTDERDVGYEFATPGPRLVMLSGRIVHQR